MVDRLFSLKDDDYNLVSLSTSCTIRSFVHERFISGKEGCFFRILKFKDLYYNKYI